MKLCQKCQDTIHLQFNGTRNKEEIIADGRVFIQLNDPPVLESECEFWSHAELIKIITDLRSLQNAVMAITNTRPLE